MKILFIGDIFGKSGISILEKKLTNLKIEKNIDLVIANGENASLNGKGLERNDYLKLKKIGIDFFTLGNHAFRSKSIEEFIENDDIIRPMNWEGKNIPGKGSRVIKNKLLNIRISSIMGQTYINEPSTNPFIYFDNFINNAEKSNIHIVDFHGEATSEKNVFGFQFDGKVSAIIGTHTHVQTADLRLNPKGTAYITDVGMTGPTYSSIGADYELVSKRMSSGLPIYFKESRYTSQINAIVMEFDRNNDIKKLERIFIRPNNIMEKE